MHARYSPKRTQLVIVCSVFWLAIMLALTLSDYAHSFHETQPGEGRLVQPPLLVSFQLTPKIAVPKSRAPAVLA